MGKLELEERTADSGSARRKPADAVELSGVWREFGDRPVLRDVSFALARGGTLALLGPNGAGKTTLLRIVATLLRPSHGEVRVLGCSLPAQAHRVRGRLGYLGHEPLLYRDLTAAENLRFQARLYGLPDDGRGRIAELLDTVGMARRANELVRNLSAGMVQRLAACRSVLHDPELLLLDEPRSHLDPEGASLVEALIGRRADRARILVAHDIEGALADSDGAVALAAGGAVAYSGPSTGLSVGDARAIYGGAL